MTEAPRRSSEFTGELYGVLGEFTSPESLIEAVEAARHHGYRRFEAYTPFPVEELPEAMKLGRCWVPPITLMGGIFGMIGGYGLQYFAAVWSYPWNVGGRPHHSWPLFVPFAFETTVLFASLGAVFGMLLLNGLPRPYHPLFNSPIFARASIDRFFLCIEAKDPNFEAGQARRMFESLGAEGVYEVEK